MLVLGLELGVDLEVDLESFEGEGLEFGGEGEEVLLGEEVEGEVEGEFLDLVVVA